MPRHTGRLQSEPTGATPLGKTFEVLDENELGEPQTASPVISNGALYMRTYEALYANRAK